MLLLSANGVVSVGRLEEALYGRDLPSTSRTQALIAVSALRRMLAEHGDGAAISRRAQGYVLQIDDGRLDSLRFAALVTAARAARDDGDLGLAAANYRDVLRLWRGPALDGLDSLLVRTAATQLDEQRMAAIEDRLALELDLGRHQEVIGELFALAEEFPLRDRLREQLMLALYRSGRAAESLRVYQQARRMMIDELGIEPGRELQRLQQAILASDPALDPPAGRVKVRPRCLSGSCGPWGCQARRYPRAWTNGPRPTGTWWLTAGCWWCSTTRPPRARCCRCCRAAGPPRCWSPAAPHWPGWPE